MLSRQSPASGGQTGSAQSPGRLMSAELNYKNKFTANEYQRRANQRQNRDNTGLKSSRQAEKLTGDVHVRIYDQNSPLTVENPGFTQV